MTEGTAAIWRDNFLRLSENELEVYDFPTYRNFILLLENNFQSTDEKAEALYQLGMITQGTHSIQDHNARFSLLVHQSGLTDEENESVLLPKVAQLRPTPGSLEDLPPTTNPGQLDDSGTSQRQQEMRTLSFQKVVTQ
jgi:hypothetical protein